MAASWFAFFLRGGAMRSGHLYGAVAGLLILFGLSGITQADDALAPEKIEFFEKHVRPVLVNHCQECHGEKKQEAGLRLDTKAHALRGADSGPVVVAGKPDDSPLIAAIRYEGYEMPPTGKLADEQIAALVKWVELGAPWPNDGIQISAYENPASAESIARARREHWAFQPVHEPAVPAVQDAAWAKSPPDAFVLAKLEAGGLRPSPQADKRTLLRRATYDLTGLPPTIEELRAFEADDSPEAFAQVVDRLLASPAFGERWARHWLDVARYGDTTGYVPGGVLPRYPFSYTYRDYVIQSFNDDVPYDQFLREQVAADCLPEPRSPQALAALGFLTAGARFLGNQRDMLDDRIDVVTRGLLGLTVTCARCHDHKFDPIPTADYYSLVGVFINTYEPGELPILAEPADTPEYRADAEELAKRQAAVDAHLENQKQERLKPVREQLANYLLATLRQIRPAALAPEAQARLESAQLDNHIVQRWTHRLRRAAEEKDSVFAAWHALVPLSPDEFAAQAPAQLEALWGDDKRPAHRLIRAALQAAPPESLVALAETYAQVLSQVDQQAQQPSEDQSADVEPDVAQVRTLLYDEEGLLNLERNFVERTLPLPARQELTRRRRHVNEWHVASLHGPPRAMVLHDVDEPAPTRIALRGNPGRPGEVVPRQYLAVLAGEDRQPFQHGSGRLELIELIASRDNPLTARVFVNRVWQHLIGQGLVRTPSNFGLQGEAPTHPELLDYLAARFMDEGWSIKQLMRMILLSSTYQQQSLLREEEYRADPDNRLLWRMNRKRLEFEPLRDTLLALSGRLDRTVGGRPFDWNAQPTVPRRAMYGLIDREYLFPTLRIFDFASPDASVERRTETTVPQQSLYLMNSPFVQEQAEALAARPEIADEPDLPKRVRTLYQMVLTREPEQEELELALEFVQAPLQSSGEKPLSAWALLAQALLLTNEVMYVD